jgi:hypothetical protein
MFKSLIRLILLILSNIFVCVCLRLSAANHKISCVSVANFRARFRGHGSGHRASVQYQVFCRL